MQRQMPQKAEHTDKRGFVARAVDNEYDRLYKNETYRWLHHIHKMEKTSDCSPEQFAALKSAFEYFKSEAKERKSAVKNGQATVAEFHDWTLRQSWRII